MITSPSSFARKSALLGALLWMLSLLVRTSDSPETDLIQTIFLFAVFVIVPLGVSLIASSGVDLSLRIAVFTQPVAAILCFVSFVLPQGTLAGIFAAIWLGSISCLALTGFLPTISARPTFTTNLSINAGMFYLPIGGAWFVASRLGLQPMGFGDTIVLLTAVHFHFAGFAAPVLAGLAGRMLPNSRAMSVAAICIVLGTPIVAAGITLSPLVGLVGTLVVAFGLALLAVLVIGWVVPNLKSKVAQVLLVISSLSSLTAMVLASLYAYSIVTQTLIIDIPQMAMTHGLLNSLGFSLCGLLAWTSLETSMLNVRSRN